jgi:hypothetical protein
MKKKIKIILVIIVVAFYAAMAFMPLPEREVAPTTPPAETMASVRIYVPDEHKPIGLKPHPTETPERMTGKI